MLNSKEMKIVETWMNNTVTCSVNGEYQQSVFIPPQTPRRAFMIIPSHMPFIPTGSNSTFHEEVLSESGSSKILI